jgi:hypothetical protein
MICLWAMQRRHDGWYGSSRTDNGDTFKRNQTSYIRFEDRFKSVLNLPSTYSSSKEVHRTSCWICRDSNAATPALIHSFHWNAGVAALLSRHIQQDVRWTSLEDEYVLGKFNTLKSIFESILCMMFDFIYRSLHKYSYRLLEPSIMSTLHRPQTDHTKQLLYQSYELFFTSRLNHCHFRTRIIYSKILIHFVSLIA